VFTGSIPAGRASGRAAAERIVPCVLELGGKSAAIVHADADLDIVLASVRSGIFFNAGQVCSAMARVLVHESIHDELLERTVELAEGLHVGHGLEPDTELTPLISSGQLERVTHMCQAGLAEGARAATGGERIDRAGHFMQPTVFTEVRPGMSIARDGIFGRAISQMKFRDPAEAGEAAKGTDYGLVAGVFTRDLDLALRTAQQLVAGQVFVNEWFAGGVETPFGGIARSGHGREKGLEALDNYLRTRNIAIRLGH
jgi:aldehyde dehydrogenase (NAD+)